MNGEKQLPFVSIVLPVKNAERTIGKTFEYLANIDYPADRREIILSDGGSKDRTLEIIREYQQKEERLRLVEVPDCPSPGEARNQALKIVQGEYIIFTDADCAPEKDWIHRLLEPFRNDPQIGAVGGEILTLNTSGGNNLVELYCQITNFLRVNGRCGVRESGYFPSLSELGLYPSYVDGGNQCPFFATANMAVSRSAMESIGMSFWAEPTGEDVDFSLRLQLKGYRLYFQKEAVVKHIHRAEEQSLFKQWFGYGYGHPLLIARHSRQGFELVFQFISPRVKLFFPFPVKGLIYLGNFQLFHLSFLIWIFSLFSGGSLLAFLLFLYFFLAYFYPCFWLKPQEHFWTWCRLRYLTNFHFLRGGIKGSFRFKAGLIDASW